MPSNLETSDLSLCMEVLFGSAPTSKRVFMISFLSGIGEEQIWTKAVLSKSSLFGSNPYRKNNWIISFVGLTNVTRLLTRVFIRHYSSTRSNIYLIQSHSLFIVIIMRTSKNYSRAKLSVSRRVVLCATIGSSLSNLFLIQYWHIPIDLAKPSMTLWLVWIIRQTSKTPLSL